MKIYKSLATLEQLLEHYKDAPEATREIVSKHFPQGMSKQLFTTAAEVDTSMTDDQLTKGMHS